MLLLLLRVGKDRNDYTFLFWIMFAVTGKALVCVAKRRTKQ